MPEKTRKTRPCTHGRSPEGIVRTRVSCHVDLMSRECADHAQYSVWVCGRPDCITHAEGQVRRYTGVEPVRVESTRGRA